jgi:hypothetical protein
MCGNTEALLLADLPSDRPKLESIPKHIRRRQNVRCGSRHYVGVRRIVSVQNAMPDRDHYGSSLMAIGLLWCYC